MAAVIVGSTRDETIRLTAERLGISIERAEFIYAIENRETLGDVVYLDDKGDPVPYDQDPRVRRDAAARYLGADLSQ